MQQVETDTEDTRYAAIAPSFFLQYKHVMITLLSLGRDVVYYDLLSLGLKICMNSLIALKRLDFLPLSLLNES